MLERGVGYGGAHSGVGGHRKGVSLIYEWGGVALCLLAPTPHPIGFLPEH